MDTFATEQHGDTLTIRVTGRMDFSVHRAFRDCYERPSEKPRTFVVDLSRVSYLDSSALGMLLLLRSYAGGEREYVHLLHANGHVLQTLQTAKFDDLFTVG